MGLSNKLSIKRLIILYAIWILFGMFSFILFNDIIFIKIIYKIIYLKVQKGKMGRQKKMMCHLDII